MPLTPLTVPDFATYVKFVEVTYNIGVKRLNALPASRSPYKEISVHDLMLILKKIVKRITAYNLQYNITPHTFDSGKFACFAATEFFLQSKAVQGLNPDAELFAGQPMFFGYFTVLQKHYKNYCKVEEIQDFLVVSENLNNFMLEGQWSTAFAYFRAMEITLECIYG